MSLHMKMEPPPSKQKNRRKNKIFLLKIQKETQLQCPKVMNEFITVVVNSILIGKDEKNAPTMGKTKSVTLK